MLDRDKTNAVRYECNEHRIILLRIKLLHRRANSLIIREIPPPINKLTEAEVCITLHHCYTNYSTNIGKNSLI